MKESSLFLKMIYYRIHNTLYSPFIDLFCFPLFMGLLGVFYTLSSTKYLTTLNKNFENLSVKYFFHHQGEVWLIGLALALVNIFIPLKIYRKLSPFLLLAILIVMAYQTVWGPLIKGTRRWLEVFGYHIQTAEFARSALILYLSWMIAFRRNSLWQKSLRSFLYFSPVLLLIALIGLQRDISSSLISLLLASVLLLLSGFPIKRLIISGAIVSILILFSILQTPYQYKRFFGHITGGEIGSNTIYQSQQSILSFARGGYWGVGLGQGQQKMGFLPEPHTDSVLSTIGEESGLMGITFLFCLYLFFGLRAGNGLLRVGDEYLSLVGWGLLISFICQFFFHIAINVGFLPHTGDPMPFLSYGGSSLLVNTWGGTLIWRIVHEESS